MDTPPPMALSLGQQFELERMNRTIDAADDLDTLRGLCKQLLTAWQNQRAATQWVMRQDLGQPSAIARQAARELEGMKKGAVPTAPQESTSPEASAPD